MDDQGAPGGVPAGVEDAWPLTPAQAGMLFHTLAAPGSGVYVGQFAARLPAGMDLDRFKAAWAAVIARHGALRSLILWEGFDDPVQVVRETLHPEWTTLPAGGEAAFEAHLAQMRVQGLDLAAGPTSRFALQPHEDGGWRFAWTCHHALVDAWSAGLVLREVETAFASDAAASAPPAPQFRAFADWMAGRDVEAAEAFWRDRLAGFAEPCRLQIHAPRPIAGAGRERARLAPAESTALREAAARLGVTLSALVQSAWAVVMHRASGRDDVVFGVATTLRAPRIAGVEKIVGNFVTTLPARFRLDGRARLADMARDRHEAALQAAPHEHLGPAAIERLAGLPPGEALFETVLAMEPPERDLPGGLFAEFSPRDLSSYPAALLVRPGEALELTLIHDGARLDGRGARLLLSMMREALAALPTSLEASPRDLPVMASAALAAAQAGEAGPPLPAAPLIPEAIARHARETPDAPAVVAGDVALTYGELDRLADLWARRLAARGLGPGDRVAVLMERGPLLPVALLAAMKAGCAYVPLDARYPEARIAAMLEAASPGAVLSTSDLADRAPGALRLDDEAAGLPEASPRPPGPDDPAYVIFTSGSTGAPKGVVILHRNLAASDAARGPVYGGAPERFLLLSPFAFDSSVVGLFWTLAGGGALHLPPPGAETDPAAIADLVAAQGITHTLCLPSVLDLLINRPAADLASLRTVIAAGEPLPRRVADRFAAALPQARLFNEYGPTEATVWCLAHEVSPGDGPVPVGRPIPGARILIRDEAGRSVPDGLPGELLVGGAGIAAGYLDRPDLTEARFPPDPGDPGSRLYCTGDLVRRRADGALDYLGRIDAQAKIRGHRVEPAEIEAALAALPGVEEAAVAARGEGPQSHLVAWLQAEPGGTPDPDLLRAALRRTLPDWMIPTRWVAVDRLPRLPSGKIDRVRLPEPDPIAEPVGAAPSTELERRLAEIWRQTLGRDEAPGVTDDFFDLGGHSLLSMRLVDAIERELGLRLPPSALARMTTIRDQAAALAAQADERSGGTPEGLHVEAAPPSPPAPGAPPVRGLFDGLDEDELRGLRAFMAGWEGERVGPQSLLVRRNAGGARMPLVWCFNAADEFAAMAERLGPDQPVIGIRSGAGLLDLSLKMEQAVHRRLALQILPDLLAVHPEGPLLIGGNCQGASMAMELTLLLSGLGRQAPLLILLDAVPLRAYDGPMALIFGRDSEFNPFKSFDRPETGWAARFRRCTVDVTPGAHETYFRENNLPAFAGIVQRRIDEALARPAAALPVAGFAVDWLSADAPERMPAGSGRRIRVELRNAGAAVWAAADEGGPRLALRWLDQAGEVVAAGGDATPAPEGLSPRAVCVSELDINAPSRPGAHVLEIDLVEQGVVRFSQMGSPPLRLAVEITEAEEPAAAAEAADGAAASGPDADAAMQVADRLSEGRRAFALGANHRAVGLLGGAREDAAALFRDLGQAELLTGETTAAEADLRLALRLDPHDAEALAALGRLRRSQGRIPEAVWLLRKSLSQRDDPDAREALRLALRRFNLPRRAWLKLRRMTRGG